MSTKERTMARHAVVQVPADFEEQWTEASALATECCINFGLLAGAAFSQMQAIVQSHGAPSLAAFNVLAIVDGAGEPLAPSAIADRMLVTRATVTGVIDSLERRG